MNIHLHPQYHPRQCRCPQDATKCLMQSLLHSLVVSVGNQVWEEAEKMELMEAGQQMDAFLHQGVLCPAGSPGCGSHTSRVCLFRTTPFPTLHNPITNSSTRYSTMGKAEPILIPHITVQSDFPLDVTDVGSGKVPSSSFWLSIYNYSFGGPYPSVCLPTDHPILILTEGIRMTTDKSTIHDKITVSQASDGGAELQSEAGINLKFINGVNSQRIVDTFVSEH